MMSISLKCVGFTPIDPMYLFYGNILNHIQKKSTLFCWVFFFLLDQMTTFAILLSFLMMFPLCTWQWLPLLQIQNPCFWDTAKAIQKALKKKVNLFRGDNNCKRKKKKYTSEFSFRKLMNMMFWYKQILLQKHTRTWSARSCRFFFCF